MKRSVRNMLLAIAVIVSLLPLDIFAATNYDSGSYDGSSGKGTTDWKYTTAGRGVRISIYFVEGERKNFADPGCQIYPIGLPTDFAKKEVNYKSLPEYIVDYYSEMSVFDYMNRSGKPYRQTSVSSKAYRYHDSSHPLSISMPDILYSNKSDWEDWFTGNDYARIPEITNACGMQISSEDFKNGIYRTVNEGEISGTYEIFFEPLVSAVVDGKGMFLSLRDAIRYNEFRTAENSSSYYDGKIVDWLNRMFVFLANRAYLVEEEIAPLNMRPNIYNNKPYLVHHEVETKAQDRAEMKREMKPGGKIYDSMGVGTVLMGRVSEEEEIIPEQEPIEPPELPDPPEPKAVTGLLRAEDRVKEKFDVSRGIPTTEDLYAQIDAEEYLHELHCTPVTDSRTETVLVQKNFWKSWQDPGYSIDCTNCVDGKTADQSDCTLCDGGRIVIEGQKHTNELEMITKTYPITRSYLYWVIDRFSMHEIEKATVNNAVLENGRIDIEVNKDYYIAPEIDLEQPTEHILVDPFEEALTYNAALGMYVLKLPDGYYWGSDVPDDISLYAEANEAISAYKVRNDSLVIDFRKKDNSGNVIHNKVTIVQSEYIPGPDDDTEAKRRNNGKAPVPGTIPASPITNENALYKEDLTVVKETPNGIYPTTGIVKYRRLPQAVNPTRDEEVNTDIENLGEVVVHTPVVCNSGIRDEYAWSQQLGNKESDRSDLVLGRESQIKFQTKYQHRNILGYGDRDYSKYIKAKYVRFPFDIYIKNSSGVFEFVPKNSWYLVNGLPDYINIRVPVWVDEGDYVVNFKTIAINAPEDIDDPSDAGFNVDPGAEGSLQEYMANKDMNNYVAYRDSKVRVVGRVENFRITDINDYPLWESVFRTKKGSSSHTGTNYTVGSDTVVFDLPIMNGSHPTQRDKGALKTGYAFKFTLDTIGEYFRDQDYIRIVPSFYYIGKDGGDGVPVDIYYNEYFNGKDNILVKIGSDKDKTNKQVIVNTDIYRNMPEEDIQRTCELSGITDKKFKGRKVDIGTYGEIKLTKDLKLYIGNTVVHPFDGGSAEAARVEKSIQRWYGEYKLPDKLFVTLAGLDITKHPEAQDGIDGKESFWLKDGYIIVNFRIETYHADKSGNITGPVLGYWHGNYNRWEAEGFDYAQNDYSGKEFRLDAGDVVFYYADKRSSDDYKVGGNR